MVPNAERIVVQHLLADEGVALPVSTEMPEEAEFPRVRITLAGGQTRVPGWLYRVTIGVEGWGDTKLAAWDALVAAVTSLETGLSGALVEDGVVSAVEHDSGVVWSPDPASRKPRYLTTVSLTVHPLPAA